MTLPLDRRRLRFALAVTIALLVLPTVVSALSQVGGHGSQNATGVENVTFVSTQGSFGPAVDGRVVALETDSREVLWEYSDGGPTREVIYYDVDPLSADELLLVEQVTGESAYVLRVNWREDRVIDRFPVPLDTHDVDYLGNDTYVVADKYDHRAYVYDRDTESVVWEYEFAEHFPEYPAVGNDPSTQRSGADGYTHLNDVDPVDGGEAFLLSPRNFDRVILVDRDTKETRFELGEEDANRILHEQHNPDLLSMDPPTVLVADSENDRVREYRRGSNGTWEATWEYADGLHWPRDADRLPSGNTLVVDTMNQRVLEVTPNGSVTWAARVSTMPYDVERLGLPDGSAGPPLDRGSDALGGAASGVSVPRSLYNRALWILPGWIGMVEFYGLVGAVLLSAGWLGGETYRRVRRRLRS